MGTLVAVPFLRRHWPWLLLPVLLALGAGRLRFDAEVLNLLPASLPAVHGLALQQRYFPAARELLVTLRCDDAGLAERAAAEVARRLESATSLVGRVEWRPPWEDAPLDLAENLAWQWLQCDPAAFERLRTRLAPEVLEQSIQEALDRLASALDPQELVRTGYDPLGLSQLEAPLGGGGAGGDPFQQGRGFFVDETGGFRLLHVEPASEEGDYRATAAWLSEVRRLAESAVAAMGDGTADRVRLGFTGGPAFRAEISAGMESDLRQSVAATVVLIAGLFWLGHRSWRPLGWLILSLGLTLAITLGLGGLLFGTLNIISVGFAAVLMGLAVDYGLVSHQEAVAHPGREPWEIRREVSRGIWYSAGTTAGTFLLLGWVGLPGLTLLGRMTALGLLVGAVVMMHFYLPKVCPVKAAGVSGGDGGFAAGGLVRAWVRLGWWPTAILAAGAVGVLAMRGFPEVTSSQDPLKPRSSEAYAAMDELRQRLNRTREPALLVIEGRDASEVAERMEAAGRVLESAKATGGVSRVELPLGFWPRDEHAARNAAGALDLAARAGAVTTALRDAGFATNATVLVERVLGAWPGLVARAGGWPTNGTAGWLTQRFAARTGAGGWIALGRVHPGTEDAGFAGGLRLPEGAWLCSWDSLGHHLFQHVRGRVAVLTGLMALVLVGCLWLAFRRWAEVVLAGLALGMSFLVLTAVMSAAGWEWDLLSLVALPLILGTSVDSTIHVQLALRRHRGDLGATWRTIGKALLLCAGANIAGFGSLAWSSNQGLANLDLICAMGVGCVFLVCVGLLPQWWLGAGLAIRGAETVAAPSSLYRARVWLAGLWLARWLPGSWACLVARVAVRGYRVLKPRRLEVVTANLLPAFDGDRAAAVRCAGRLFDEFAFKLVELWRLEAGAPALAPVVPGLGWEHFAAARAAGRGVLLVTPHLGNWELGSVLLTGLGVTPMVLTAPEPGEGLTEARIEARRRLGVRTVVVGADPFALVPVIRHLQSGGVVALLIDRAPEAHSVETPFLGRPFRASLSAAELARASGAVVLPVYIVREGMEHRAHALPEVGYDRRSLGDRSAREELAGRILRAFEPAVRQFPDQWFHFVPAWVEREPAPPGGP